MAASEAGLGGFTRPVPLQGIGACPAAGRGVGRGRGSGRGARCAGAGGLLGRALGRGRAGGRAPELRGAGRGREACLTRGPPGHRRYLSVREGVVVGPHLGVHVLQVPLEAAAFQPLAQGQPLGHVPEVHPGVLEAEPGRTGAECVRPTPLPPPQRGAPGMGALLPRQPRLRAPRLDLVWGSPLPHPQDPTGSGQLFLAGGARAEGRWLCAQPRPPPAQPGPVLGGWPLSPWTPFLVRVSLRAGIRARPECPCSSVTHTGVGLWGGDSAWGLPGLQGDVSPGRASPAQLRAPRCATGPRLATLPAGGAASLPGNGAVCVTPQNQWPRSVVTHNPE